MEKSKFSPLHTQWLSIKAKYPDCIVLFRCGDFYKLIGDCAESASKVLGITLTTRLTQFPDTRTNLAGFPCDKKDDYLLKLTKAGYKVALCDNVD